VKSETACCPRKNSSLMNNQVSAAHFQPAAFPGAFRVLGPGGRLERQSLPAAASAALVRVSPWQRAAAGGLVLMNRGRDPLRHRHGARQLYFSRRVPATGRPRVGARGCRLQLNRPRSAPYKWVTGIFSRPDDGWTVITPLRMRILVIDMKLTSWRGTSSRALTRHASRGEWRSMRRPRGRWMAVLSTISPSWSSRSKSAAGLDGALRAGLRLSPGSNWRVSQGFDSQRREATGGIA